MSSLMADDRYYNVQLSLGCRRYVAEVWRDSLSEWVLLSVCVSGLGAPIEVRKTFSSLKNALLEAEIIVTSLVA